VGGGEVHRDVGDLGEEVEVGGQGGDGAVEEHHVLHEEHQLLGHPGAVAEQRLDHPLDLGDQLVGRQVVGSTGGACRGRGRG
jgi:hypothetical protein